MGHGRKKITTHRDNRYTKVCSGCGKLFVGNAAVRLHARINHPDGPDGKITTDGRSVSLVCGACGKEIGRGKRHCENCYTR